jgi:hypothetical protein
MKHHKTLDTLPVGCYDNYMKSGQLGWLCIFDYETHEPPQLTDEESEIIKAAFDSMVLEIPEGILSDEELFKIEQIKLAEYTMLANFAKKDEIGSDERQEYYDALYKLNKLKNKAEEPQPENKTSLFDQCIFIEQVLKCNNIDIYKMPTAKYFKLLKLSIEKNQRENEKFTE